MAFVCLVRFVCYLRFMRHLRFMRLIQIVRLAMIVRANCCCPNTLINEIDVFVYACFARHLIALATVTVTTTATTTTAWLVITILGFSSNYL